MAFNYALYSWFISLRTKFLPLDIAKSYYIRISFFNIILNKFSAILITTKFIKKAVYMPDNLIKSSF